MDDKNTGISEEQLAYLNDNLDLVDEYVINRLQREHPALVVVCTAVVRCDRYCSKVYVKINDKNCGFFWRPLLQFVKDHQNTPPIFK